jgi:drug/metabolite transporter (DMT)-like permease
MKLKMVALLAFLFNAFLFGTYYAVAKDALERIDPIVFTFFTMMALVPVALCIIVLSWQEITRDVVKSGVLLGSCLCLGLFTLAVALKHNSATSTAFFPSLNGFLAAACVSLFLRQPIGKATWLAGVVSVGGALLLILNSEMGGARGALIAFIGGLFCTLYIFLSEREQRDKTAYWALFGIQLLTMALWANLLALLFGDWQSVHPSLPKDIWIILFISLGTICLPVLISVLLQNHISPVTVSFIYILEPVFGAIFSNLYLHEVLPFNGYVGGGLIVAGAVIHTWGSASKPSSDGEEVQQQLVRMGRRVHQSRLTLLGYPALCFGVGAFILYRIGGFPPPAWRTFYQLLPILPEYMQEHSLVGLLLVAQSFCWLVAWASLIGLGILVALRTKLMFMPKAQLEAQLPEVQPKMQEEREAWDMRTLRQRGVKPAVSSVRRREEKPEVQRRRRERIAERMAERTMERMVERTIERTF